MANFAYLNDGPNTVLQDPDEYDPDNPANAPPFVPRVPLAPVGYQDAQEQYRTDPGNFPQPLPYPGPDQRGAPELQGQEGDFPGIIGMNEGMLQPQDDSSPDIGGYAQRPPPPSKTPRLDELEKTMGEMPQRPTPKWYQRLGAAALGGAVGWSNAAGRARPIDPTQAEQGILYGGYQNKLADWKNRLLTAQQRSEIEAKRTEMEQKARKLESDIAHQKAQSDYYEGVGRSNMVTITPEMQEFSGGRYATGQRIPSSLWAHVEDIEAGKYVRPEKPEKTIVIKSKAIADRLGFNVGDPVPYSLYQTGVNANTREELSEYSLRYKAFHDKDPAAIAAVRNLDNERARTALASKPPRSEVGELLARERMDKAEEKALEDIGNKKQNAENNAYKFREQELRRIDDAGMGGPEKNAARVRIDLQTRNALQNAMATYVSAARAHHVEGVDDYDIGLPPTPGGDYFPYTAKRPVSPVVGGPGAAPAGRPDPVTGQPLGPGANAAPPAIDPITGRPVGPIVGTPVSPGIQAAANEANAEVAGPGRGAPATSPQYTEAEIRAAAISKRKDPDAAVALARKANLLK